MVPLREGDREVAVEIIEAKTRAVVAIHLGVIVVTESAIIIVTTHPRIVTTITTTIAIGGTTTPRTKVATPMPTHQAAAPPVPRATTPASATNSISEVVATTRQRHAAPTTLNQPLLRIAISSRLARIVRIWGVVEGPRGAEPLLLRRTMRAREEVDVSSNSSSPEKRAPLTPHPGKSAKTNQTAARTKKTPTKAGGATTPSPNPPAATIRAAVAAAVIGIDAVAVAVALLPTTTTNAAKVRSRPLLSSSSSSTETRAGVVSVAAAAVGTTTLRWASRARTRAGRLYTLRNAKITAISSIESPY